MQTVKELTQLDGGEEQLIKQKPFGDLFSLTGEEIYKMVKSPYYGLRTVECESDGHVVKQALINFLGTPAWINLSHKRYDNTRTN